MEEARNPRPKEGSNIPNITLAVLICIIAAMLFAGWEYLSEKPSSSELTTDQVDSTALSDDNTEPVSSDPVPVKIIEQQPSVNTTATVSTKPAPQKPALETPKPQEIKTTPEEPKPAESLKTPDLGGEEITHTIEAGQTFYGVANRYNLKFSTLQALNPQIKDVSKDVKSGVTRIKVRVKAIHTVGAGDVLRVVAQKYGISKELLMRANGKTKDYAQRGEKLIIPFAEKK